MKYLSVCSGIEAASVAWHPLGWRAFVFSEIEKFPSAVLAHHYPNTPNLGDMTRFKEWPNATLDLLVGGTPCQSFSVAGLRKGLADPRGDLMLTFGAIAERYRPRWLVWENVPGVLSSNDGRDFGTFLGMLGELGYGFAYRVLDAQFFGVPQRRRRVFVVGHLGDWRRAAAVLFERHSLSGHPAPRREAGKEIAGTLRAGSGGGCGPDVDDAKRGMLIAKPVLAGGNARNPLDETLVMSSGQANAEIVRNVSTTLTTLHEAPIVAHALRGEGFDASEDGTGRGIPLVPMAFDYQGSGKQTTLGASVEHTGALGTTKVPAVAGMQVRRLTPRECERLQGFPDDYTLIPVGKKMAADGPRYKALGNSMAVPVMRWIGERIQQVEDICENAEKAA